MTELPATWANAKFSDFGTWIGGGTPSKANPRFWNGPIPWVSPKDMKTKVIRKAIDGITEEAVENSAAKLVPAGSVLIVTRSGILAHTLPIAVTAVESTLNQDLKALALPDGIGSEYIAWGMRAFEQSILDKCRKGGTTVHSIEMPRLASFELPIAPTNEQRRIVEKIEAMFDEIDKGVESLHTARTTLGLYRQSLLKSAFEGRLTADWRAKNADKLKDPKTLLARIQRERDTRYKTALDAWQDALATWHAGGEKGKKPAKPKRLAEIDPPTVSVKDEGWAELPLGALIGKVQQGWSPKCDDGRPIAPDDWTIVTTTAVQHHRYSDKEIKLLPARFEPRPEIEIKAGDFLMTRKGPRARTGVVCLVPATRHRIMLCDTVYRFRCDETAILPRLLEFALNSPLTLREIDELKSGISDSGISLNHGKIKSVLVKFPLNKAEQAEIVRILDEKLEAADALEAEIDAALARADALRQSILKKAFSGQLVPQDAKDEPASALLERIKADRAMTPRTKKRKTAHA
ncbi:restriction endonuclease subunit S [uncultured Tateyamaria sp.]|uniref:restriction endonuclease subunit S n=1 Tax=uncultured Tateyamaria sp. TaxID=455651 RepID=UPI002623E6C7|nr:restriction endonuclease subunit S [uncultured Tateyamaria sp.]